MGMGNNVSSIEDVRCTQFRWLFTSRVKQLGMFSVQVVGYLKDVNTEKCGFLVRIKKHNFYILFWSIGNAIFAFKRLKDGTAEELNTLYISLIAAKVSVVENM